MLTVFAPFLCQGPGGQCRQRPFEVWFWEIAVSPQNWLKLCPATWVFREGGTLGKTPCSPGDMGNTGSQEGKYLLWFCRYASLVCSGCWGNTSLPGALLCTQAEVGL